MCLLLGTFKSMAEVFMSGLLRAERRVEDLLGDSKRHSLAMLDCLFVPSTSLNSTSRKQVLCSALCNPVANTSPILLKIPGIIDIIYHANWIGNRPDFGMVFVVIGAFWMTAV